MSYFIKRIDREISIAFGHHDRKYRAAAMDFLACASFAIVAVIMIAALFAMGGAS